MFALKIEELSVLHVLCIYSKSYDFVIRDGKKSKNEEKNLDFDFFVT